MRSPRYHSSSSCVYHSISPFLMAQQKTENPQPQSSTSARGLGLSYTHRRIQCMPVTLYKFWGEVVKGCCLNLGAPATLLLSSKLIPPPLLPTRRYTWQRSPCTCTNRKSHAFTSCGGRNEEHDTATTCLVFSTDALPFCLTSIQLANRGTTVVASPDPFPCSIWGGRIFEMGGILHTHFNCSVLETPDVGLNKVVWCWTMSNTHHRTVCTHAQHTKMHLKCH